jgi:hypothetical protein
MVGFATRVLGLSGCLLALLAVLPAHADPSFVRVYGRTYKIDPRYTSDEPKGPKPEEAMKALPSDIGRGPGFRPSHQQVLAEVEELIWIARSQLDKELEETASSRNGQNAEADAQAAKAEITGSLAIGAPLARSLEWQKRYDRHRALNLLVRELRRFMDLPTMQPGAGFSRPKLSPEIELSYRALNFDPIAAYYAFRRVKAAFRSGDVELVARVAHYAVAVTGKNRRTIRNRDQLAAAKATIMDPRIREIVANSTFETVFVRDKGMMLGEGEVWITYDKRGIGLGAVNLE